MEIKPGSRWIATGRNIERFECEITKVLIERRANGLNQIYVKDEKGHFFTYNRDFFLTNFEPIKDEKMRDFKFGDRIEVKFEAYIDKFSDVGVYIRGKNYQNLHVLNNHITLIERAKPDYCLGDLQNRIERYFNSLDKKPDTIEQFFHDYYKLISEGDNG